MVMRADVTVTIPRGLMRIAGTTGGALTGLLLAPAVADAPLLLLAALFAVSWIGTFRRWQADTVTRGCSSASPPAWS